MTGFFIVCRQVGREGAIVWLVLASLFYYGWWNPDYVGLILVSMVVNFAIGRSISRLGAAARGFFLAAGVVFNLLLLGYFKYASFFADTAADLTGADIALAPIVLPLAISFFTFQQIAYLADAYRGKASEYSFRTNLRANKYPLTKSSSVWIIPFSINHNKKRKTKPMYSLD